MSSALLNMNALSIPLSQKRGSIPFNCDGMPLQRLRQCNLTKPTKLAIKAVGLQGRDNLGHLHRNNKVKQQLPSRQFGLWEQLPLARTVQQTRMLVVKARKAPNKGKKAEDRPVKSYGKIPDGKEKKIVYEGLIKESLPNGMFWVRLDKRLDKKEDFDNVDNEDNENLASKSLILGYISGRIRHKSVRMEPGDRVNIEVSRYDPAKGRIVYRL